MKGVKSIVFGLLALPVIVSCNNDDAQLTEIADREIALSLSLNTPMQSRASIGKGMLDSERYIIDGDYAIIMKDGDYAVQVHCCRFGTSVLDNGRRGNIYLVENGEPKAAPLKWSEINLKKFDFIIDNLGYTDECTYNAETAFFGREWTYEEKTTTYAAQRERYDESGNPEHTNDIIWGTGTALYGSDGKDVSYAELTHRMTRVNVAFVNLEQQKIKKVEVSNLVLEPESFNRADGRVTISETSERKNLVLLDSEQGDELNEIPDETAGGTYIEHVTDNYILPPQALTDGNWPLIIVTYTDESGTEHKVQGMIPHDILNEDGNTWEALDGLNAGDHLTIVAEIKDQIPAIVFTAQVRKWVNLGPLTVSADRDESITRGIRSLEDLERCIELYNALPQFNGPDSSWDHVWTMQQRLTNFGELMQYGDCEILKYVSTDEGVETVSQQVAWTFHIEFDLETLPKTGFRYMLSYITKQEGDWLTPWTYPLTLIDKNGNAGTLNDLMNKRGIYNMEDLYRMIRAFNEKNTLFMRFYGDVNEKTYTYTIELCDNISGDLLNTLNYEVWGNPKPKVILITNGFKVNDTDNVGELIGIQ